MLRLFLFVLALGAALVSPVSRGQSIPGLVFLQPPASQVAGPYSSYFPPGQTGWAVRNPTVSRAVAVSGGAVDVVASGSARAAVGTAVIDIPATVTTRVAGSGVATAVGRAAIVARGLAGPVGLALTGYAIYDLIKSSGIKTCPPPDFFCKPGPGETTPAAVDGGWKEQSASVFGNGFKTPQEVCDYFATTGRYSGPRPRETIVTSPTTARCVAPAYKGLSAVNNAETPYSYGTTKTCPTGYHLYFDDLTCEKDSPALVPAEESDINAAVGKAITSDASGAKAKAGLDAVEDANVRIKAAGGTPIVTSTVAGGSGTSVTAPPVNAPNMLVVKRDFTDANGVPQTETTQVQTTVTPQAQGSGTSTSITYNIQNTTTITTTNNTYNNTSNPPTVDVKKDQTVIVPSPPVPPVEIPTDYNREVTQLGILEQLKTAFGPITAKPPTGDDELKSVKDQNDKGVAVVDSINEGSIGLAGWFPDIPTAKCVDPRVPAPITGVMTAVPICDKVDIFQTFISAVVCVFALFGCVREVQSALKA